MLILVSGAKLTGGRQPRPSPSAEREAFAVAPAACHVMTPRPKEAYHHHSHRRRRHRRSDAGAQPAPIGFTAKSSRRGRTEAARRRHQHPAGRGPHPVELGLLDRLAATGRAHRAALRQPARPDDLGRSARPPCRPAVAAILDPSRRAADDPVRRRREDAGSGPDQLRPAHRGLRAEGQQGHGAASSIATARPSRRRRPTS